MKNAKQKEHKIHVALPDDVHQKLRVKCAIEDKTIQEFVLELVKKAVKDVNFGMKETANAK